MSKAGLSQLMEAEQKAADIIQAARLLKKQRKAQADQDAMGEITKYQDQKAQEFEQIKASQADGADDKLQQLSQNAEAACATLKQEFEANKDKAAAILCNYVGAGLL